MRRSNTQALTLPITNVPMAQLVGIGDWDDVPTQVDARPLSPYEQEAIAALTRHEAMRGRALTRKAWHHLRVRLADARLQLTVGMTAGEAMATPLVKELLAAELNAGYECCGRLARRARCCSSASPLRCDDAVAVGRRRVLIPVMDGAEVAS